MKTIGMLGGKTYHSTLLYYQQINAHIQRAKGGSNAASLIMHSFNFAETAALFGGNKWDEVTAKFTAAAKHMKAAGAQGLVIGCNIGHRVASEVEAGAGLPVLHIAEYTARAVKARGLSKVALLATRSAMEGDFIKTPLLEQAGAEILVPSTEDMATIDKAIFNELSIGVVSDETKTFLGRVAHDLVEQGAEGVILACTDLQFVLKPEHFSVPLLDTLELHAEGIAEWALDDGPSS